jgi:hypothetical protein
MGAAKAQNLTVEPQEKIYKLPFRIAARFTAWSLARTLGLWVRFTLKTRMSVLILFVLSCLYVTALLRADPPCKSDYETEEEGRGPQNDCSVINEWMELN